MIELRVDGTPRGKGRPRFDTRSGRVYTEAQTMSAEQRVQAAWLASGRPRIDGPVRMLLEIVIGRPKNHWLKDGSLSTEGERHPWPVRKPDLDNALKLVCDALNGCAYRDDVDIVRVRVLRRWANPGEHDHTRILLDHIEQPTLRIEVAA